MTSPELKDTSLIVRRTYDAPIDRVWSALTDPGKIAKWYHPGPMTTEVGAWEARPGGDLDITMVAPDEMELPEGDPGRYQSTGTFREVEDGKRLVHTWRWAGEGGGEEESLVTMELREVDDGTEVVLTHTKLADREDVERHAEGWVGCLENLATVL